MMKKFSIALVALATLMLTGAANAQDRQMHGGMGMHGGMHRGMNGGMRHGGMHRGMDMGWHHHHHHHMMRRMMHDM
jgi:hypothetical protein